MSASVQFGWPKAALQMKMPIIIADLWGMPPSGVIASAVIVAVFIWLSVLQIKGMLPEMRRYPYTWPQIIRGFFTGFGSRVYWLLNYLFHEGYRLGASLLAGFLIQFGLVKFLSVNIYIAYGVGAVLALIMWFTYYGGGGGGGQHERGRRFPTRRDG